MILRDYQTEASDFLVPRRRGFVIAPAGAGKTIIGAHALSRVLRPGMKALWIANTKEQVEQAGAALAAMPGPQDVELRIECAAGDPDTAWADVIVFDEAHHAPAPTWLAAASRAGDKVIWGLSATPWHKEEERNEIVRALFKEFHLIERERVLASGHLVPGKVYMHDFDAPGQFDERISAHVKEETERRVRKFPVLFGDPGYIRLSCDIKTAAAAIEAKCGRDFLLRASRSQVVHENQPEDVQLLLTAAREASEARDKYVYRYHERRAQWQVTQEIVQENPARNNAIVTLAQTESAAKAAVLVLVHSIEHGEALARQISATAAVVHSKLPAKKRAALIAGFRSGEVPVLIATSLADEGLDVPRAETLILAAGGRSAGKLEQRAGRVLRPFPGKAAGRIHDFLDRGAIFAFAQARAREAVYQKLGYDPEVVKY